MEETLRIEAPVKGDFRLARRPTTVGGVDIPAGATLMVLNGAANRDPRHFEDPAELRVDRDNAREHLAFGRGVHSCPGGSLARLEARVSVERLLDRTSEIRISEAHHGPAGRPPLRVRADLHPPRPDPPPPGAHARRSCVRLTRRAPAPAARPPPWSSAATAVASESVRFETTDRSEWTLTDGRRGPPLRGRQRECAALERLLDAVRADQSGVLVIRGEAGVGKSALLDHLQEQASGCRIARAAGVESEMELAFAGLHQLCASMLPRLDRLPAPQRDALGTAFGLAAGPPPDRFLVGLATLGLLAGVADEQPLVCVVDDAQWLDHASAQTIAFVARRVLAEPIAFVIAVRGHREDHVFDPLPELTLPGLSDSDARALLEAAVPGRLDERVRDRIVAETRGNPLALLELPRGLTTAELAGGFARPDVRRGGYEPGPAVDAAGPSASSGITARSGTVASDGVTVPISTVPSGRAVIVSRRTSSPVRRSMKVT